MVRGSVHDEAEGSRIRPGRIPAEGGVCVVGSGAVGRAIVGFSRYA